MVPCENGELVSALKLPVGNDGFFNEIHPKLRPVETIVDGVTICGSCQSPKNSAEAVASGLAAVTHSGAMLKRGYAELDPMVAIVDTDACTWCGKCLEACPYDALEQVEMDGKQVAQVIRTACKGCGGCVPVCPVDATDLQGYSDAQIKCHDRRHDGGELLMTPTTGDTAGGAPAIREAAPAIAASARSCATSR